MPLSRIGAAFRSSKHNECFVFVDDKYVVLNYAPGGRKDRILKGPQHIVAGFPVLARTPFENGINCAFETQHNEAYIFSGDHCARIDYAPHSTHHAKIHRGPTKITNVFTCLRGTAFEHGIDAAIRTLNTRVLLFKGDAYALMDYHTDSIHANHYIRTGFKTLVGTVFENGIDAAFKSDKNDEAYIFKQQYYACVNIDQGHPIGGHLLGGRVKRIHDDWNALRGIMQFH
ncbi:hypothetical protein RYX36_008317 [Vicia faba]